MACPDGGPGECLADVAGSDDGEFHDASPAVEFAVE